MEDRDNITDLVSLPIEDIESILESSQVQVEANQIGGKIEVKLHEKNGEYPKRVLGKSRSDTRTNALKAAIFDAWSTNFNDVRDRFLVTA